MNSICTTQTCQFVDQLLKQQLLPAITDYLNRQYQIHVTVDELYALSAKPIAAEPVVIPLLQSTTCIWKSNHGKSQVGKVCGKPTANGTEYCSACLKKKTVQKKLAMPTTVKQITTVDIHYDEKLDYYVEYTMGYLFIENEQKNDYIAVGKLVNGTPVSLSDNDVTMLTQLEFEYNSHYDLNQDVVKID